MFKPFKNVSNVYWGDMEEARKCKDMESFKTESVSCVKVQEK